jgi:hypothetical protein
MCYFCEETNRLQESTKLEKVADKYAPNDNVFLDWIFDKENRELEILIKTEKLVLEELNLKFKYCPICGEKL